MSFHTDKLRADAHTHTDTQIAADNNTRGPKVALGKYGFENCIFKMTATSPREQWVHIALSFIFPCPLITESGIYPHIT